MSRWFMGTIPGVGAAVRVTKDNADDPKTTQSTEWQKFAFDSESATKLGYVYDIREMNYDLVTWPRPATNNTFAKYFLPTGTGDSDSAETVWTLRDNGSTFFDGSQYHVIYPDTLEFSYTPILESRRYIIADASFEGPTSAYRVSDTYNGGETGYVEGWPSYVSRFENTWRDPQNVDHSRLTFSLFGWQAGSGVARPSYFPAASGTNYRHAMSFLELPAGNQAMPSYAGAPVVGQKVLRIAPDAVAMAYPGHDVSEGSREAFIFSSDRIPAKVIGAGEVQVNSGANVKVLTKRPTTFSTYVDAMVRRTSDAMYHPPYLPSGTAKSLRLKIEYVIEADGVRFVNNGDYNCVIRYMVFADDDSAPTAGGSKVFHKGNDGSADFIQLKRPGSSDAAPGLNDSILDTRLPYVPIVDEGWLAYVDFTETSDNGILGTRRKTISFTNDGSWRPFVKYMVTWDDGSIRQPNNRILRSFNLDQAPRYDNVVAGNTTNCRVSTNKLEFYRTDNSTPWRTEVKSGAFGTYADPVGGPNLVGIRWYLFAIPLSLGGQS